MPVPLQYQSQFIPTDFGTVQNVLGMYRQDMGQREQQFDQGVAMRDKALSEIYGMKTLDPELFQQIGDTLSKRIDELVTKRGMDYGAAAPEISRLIAQEARNPIYGLNQRKLEQVAMLEEALARNPNLKVIQDPRKTALSSNLNGEDLTYSVLDPEEVRKAALNMSKFLDTKKLAGIRTDKSGYDVGVYNMGPSEQDLQTFISKPENVQQLKQMFPQIGDSEDLKEFLSTTLYDAARSYQRQPEETILGFNPYIRERIQNEGSTNPYASVLPTSKVGAEGIQKIYPIKDVKDFWKMPDDSENTLIKQSIIMDIVSDKDFVKNNGELLNQFGSVENARKIKNNYTPENDILKSPAIKEYLKDNPDYLKGTYSAGERYAKLGQLYQQLVAQGEINPEYPKIKRDEYNKASELVNNFENKLSERLNKENEDLLANFEHYNVFTGIEKLDAATQSKKERMQKFVKEDLDLTDLNFETSNNKDINFSDQLKLAKKGNKDYLKASENGFEIVGIAIDPIQGVKVKVETKNADGGTTIHIASPASLEMEQQLVRAYTGGTNNEIWKKYEQYDYSRLGEQIVKNFTLAPEVAPQSGVTVGQYKRDLESKIRSGAVNPRLAKSVLYYLELARINENITL